MSYDVRLLGFSEARDALKDLGDTVNQAMRRQMLRAAFYLQSAVVFEASGGTVGGPKSVERSGGIRRARGKLGQSFQADAVQQGTDWVGRVGSSSVYARILEEGGPINPVNVRYLTLPLTREAATRGAREMDLFFWENQETDKKMLRASDSGEPQFLLVDHVDMPAFRYLTVAQNKARAGINNILDGAVDVGVQKWGTR